MQKYLFLLCLIFYTQAVLGQGGNFNGGGNGAGCGGPGDGSLSWSCNNSWSTGTKPTSANNATIAEANCNVNSTGEACNNLTVNSGRTLNIANGGVLVVHGNLTVSGTLNINTGGSLTVNGSITINAGGTISDNRAGTGTFNMAGTSITNNGTLAQPGSLYANLTNAGTVNIGGTSTDYNNFAFSLVTSGQVVNFDASTNNIYGFSVNQGVTFNIANDRTVSLLQLSIAGNANFNNATIIIRGATTSSVSPDERNPYFPTGQTGEGTFNAGTSTIIYDGDLNQFVRSTTYYNLTVRNYNTRTKGIGNAYIAAAFGQAMPVNVGNNLSLEVISSGGISSIHNPVNIGNNFNLATNNTAFSMDLYADHLMQRTGGQAVLPWAIMLITEYLWDTHTPLILFYKAMAMQILFLALLFMMGHRECRK